MEQTKSTYSKYYSFSPGKFPSLEDTTWCPNGWNWVCLQNRRKFLRVSSAPAPVWDGSPCHSLYEASGWIWGPCVHSPVGFSRQATDGSLNLGRIWKISLWLTDGWPDNNQTEIDACTHQKALETLNMEEEIRVRRKARFRGRGRLPGIFWLHSSSEDMSLEPRKLLFILPAWGVFILGYGCFI